jgi:uncharacterized protein YuzE
MRVRYFSDTDTALVEFTGKDVAETKEIGENIFIDLDGQGNLVSMTIEHARSVDGRMMDPISRSRDGVFYFGETWEELVDSTKFELINLRNLLGQGGYNDYNKICPLCICWHLSSCIINYFIISV